MSISASSGSFTQAPFSMDGDVCYVTGDWSVQALATPGQIQLRRQAMTQATVDMRWDLHKLERLDTIGAQLLWQAWDQHLPQRICFSPGQHEIFMTLKRHRGEPRRSDTTREPLRAMGMTLIEAGRHGVALLTLLGQLILDLASWLRRPQRGPWREISAQIYRVGVQALGITALVGFLIGVVLAYLSAQQLQLYGADRFIVRLLAISIVRELGPVLAAILVAGRSGSAITAQIGVMRVTQELDAMRVMGISPGERLILPRVLALAVAMPLLVLWTDAMAILGGMLAAQLQLGISLEWFLESLPRAITLSNYGIGMLKGMTFGILIALIACHFGLRIQPNTESLGHGTTTSVVTAITGVILVDALYAILFSRVGYE